MKKNLLYGIIGGAAVGAAASYLMGSKERKNLVSGLKSLSETVGSVGGLLGGSEESESGARSSQGSSSNSGSKSGRSTSGSSKSGSSSTSRRG